MIAKVAHIVLNTTDFYQYDTLFREIGYSREFLHDGIPNPKNKQIFMYDWTDTQRMALYNKGGSIPIEVIDYGHTARNSGRFSLHYDIFDQSICEENIIDKDKLTESDTKFNNILVETSLIEESIEFWEDIGLKKQGKKVLKYNSALQEIELTVNLLSGESLGRSYLDSKNFSCLSFFTTSIQSDLKRINDSGYETSDINKLEFSDYAVEIGFISGPHGEMVELIEVVD